VTDWQTVFLGVIAAATLIMALIQIGIIVVAARVARQAQQAVARAQDALASAQQTITSVREDIRPLIGKANHIAEEAAKTADLATAQAQKVDHVVTDLARRIEETSALVQQAIVTPAREGIAIMAAIKAAMGALREGADWRRRRSGRSEDEDPLFIG
jgi:predicted PurR-regulated permease PerM